MPVGENGNMSGEAVAAERVPGSPVSPESISESAPERARERYSEILSSVASATRTDTVTDEADVVAVDAESVYNEMDTEARVTKLLSLAETKSPEHAVRVAIKLNDFYVLDRMHDELVERFYDALVAKGIIKV